MPPRLGVLLSYYSGRPYETFEFAKWTDILLIPEQKRSSALSAARIDVVGLLQLGCLTPKNIRLAGIDALELARDDCLACQLVKRFDANELSEAFVSTPPDAVTAAGTEFAERFGITLSYLLGLCRGLRQQAHACIEQTIDRWMAGSGVGRSVPILPIRRMSPIGEVKGRLLVECDVYLPGVKNWQFEFFSDVDTQGLSHEECLGLGLPRLWLR